MTYTFDIPAIVVPRDATVGTVIYSSPRQQAQPATSAYAKCLGSTSWYYMVRGATQVTNMTTSTFATSVPGIGIRFFSSSASGTPPKSSYFGPDKHGTFTAGGAENHKGEYYGIELVLTGQAEAGAIAPTVHGEYSIGGLTVSVLQITGGQIIPKTCQIVADSNVDLPTITTSALPSIGATTGSTPFRITLTDCPAQMNAIQYRLDAPGGVIDASAGTFLAGTTSTVKGVDLMVTDDADSAFALATAHTLDQYDPSTGGTYPIGFRLKYFRTGAVSAGKLQGQLSYTISYQ
ncbi:fimbrial protein [Paraburkholderia sp. C35]|uniref:fimbrial protein n=1 Tax=Paraburkholderia sp. C35 TaxID=2126993 RepID=UPI0013A5B510|nr:fimbrial protein [Paraburkholderia sp. C35]